MSNVKSKLAAALVLVAATVGAAHADTYHASQTANNLRDISGATTVANADDVITSVNLPFNFTFYGQSYSKAGLSTNGFLSFTQMNNGCCTGYSFPNASQAIGAAVAPAWTDWVGTVKVETLGQVGSREYVIAWQGHEYNNSGQADFEAILHEGTNNIEFQYNKAWVNSHAMSAGIQNANASEGLNIPTGANLDGKAYLISAVPEPETYAMLAAGLGLLGLMARRRKA